MRSSLGRVTKLMIPVVIAAFAVSAALPRVMAAERADSTFGGACHFCNVQGSDECPMCSSGMIETCDSGTDGWTDCGCNDTDTGCDPCPERICRWVTLDGSPC